MLYTYRLYTNDTIDELSRKLKDAGLLDNVEFNYTMSRGHMIIFSTNVCLDCLCSIHHEMNRVFA